MNISQFKKALKGGGARANLFEVELVFPAFAGGAEETRLGRFMVKAAQLPGSTLGVIEQPFQGRVCKLPGDRTFQEWTVTVVNDTGFELRNAFERWSNGINTHAGNQGGALEDIFSTAAIHQLDRQGNRIKSYDFRDVWPSEVAPIDVAQDSNNQIEEFTVTLVYNEWVSDTTD